MCRALSSKPSTQPTYSTNLLNNLLNQPTQPTYSINLLNQPTQPTYLTNLLNQPTQPTYSTYLLNQPSQPTYSTNLLNQPTQPTYSTYLLNQPSQPTYSTNLLKETVCVISSDPVCKVGTADLHRYPWIPWNPYQININRRYAGISMFKSVRFWIEIEMCKSLLYRNSYLIRQSFRVHVGYYLPA